MLGTFKWTGILAVVVAAVAGLTGGALKVQASDTNAQQAIASVYAWQSNQTDFAPTLTNLLTESQGNVALTANSTVSYRSSGTHYVFAQQIGSSILVGSDTHRYGFKCSSEYDAECVAQVTADPYLINAAPLWIVPVGERASSLTDYLPTDMKSALPAWVLDLLTA